MSCLPNLPKAFRQRARLAPDRQHGFESLRKTRSRGTVSAHFCRSRTRDQRPRGPGTGKTKLFWRGNMESRRATNEHRRARTELDSRFGQIGISAVAAALQYRSDSKNVAYAPVEPAKLETEDA